MTSAETVKEEPGREFMSAVKGRREQDRKEWAAYWNIRWKEVENSFVGKYSYYANRFLDWPVTWFRENIVERLHDKHKMPYYHRKISRVPEIDECGVNDRICLFEAEEQFRLDKLVDHYIRDVSFKRYDHLYKCAKHVDDYENAELNFFIKYGELGSEQTVAACYMKQKHRLIWERRHPEIMEERKRAHEEHIENMNNDKFNMHFWIKDNIYRKKQDYPPGLFFGPNWDGMKLPTEGDHPISRDWRYYQKLEEEPDFDKPNYPKKWNEMARAAKEAKDQLKMANNGTNENNKNGGTNGNGTANGNAKNGSEATE
ncbi:hypothetical protein niasHT_007275 [Heterodera trifolii]|uniref:NADH dehydrogenase [ubiquinone] 1 beta subcomplex subunit 10 n=1 Tax=Heterodera trifolii TaxID=157864 RepID=A0ABD2LMS9_9BILA